MDSLLERFLAHKGTVEGASLHTLRSYRTALGAFAAFCDDAGRTLRTGELAQAREWLSAMLDGGAAESSIAQRMAALRSFYTWAAAEGLDVDKRICELPARRLSKLLPRVPSLAEVERVIAAADVRTWMGLRDRAIVRTLYAGGLRCDELCGLDVSDLEGAREMVLVTGKGDRWRYVPIGPPAVEAIMAYRAALTAARKRKTDPGGPLFVNRGGVGRLTTRSVGRLIERLAAAAGVPDLSPHSLRHAAASHMVGAGAPLRIVQEMLGHRAVSSTAIYARLQPRQLCEFYGKYAAR